MEKPTIYIFDCVTQTGFNREMNDEEYETYLCDQEKWEAQFAKLVELKAKEEAEAEAEASAQAKLAALGLTAEEIAALGK